MNDRLRKVLRERTLVLIKPEAVARGLVGAILERFERVGFKIVGCKMLLPTRKQISGHLPRSEDWIRGMGEKFLESCRDSGANPAEISDSLDPLIIGRKIEGWIYDYMMSGRVMVLVLQGPHAVATVRKMIGHTLPHKAMPGTIRGDFSISSSASSAKACCNVVHASGTVPEAESEIRNWFKPDELSDAEPAL